VTHFGVARDVKDHIAQLRGRLDEWTAIVAAGASLDEFEAKVSGISEEVERAMPLWQSYAGLKRWADKRAAA
jgi:hypothetical protein